MEKSGYKSWDETAGRFNAFASTDHREITQILSMARMARYARGELIYMLDDPAETVYWIKEGRVSLTNLTEDGREILLEILKPGELFGDIAAIFGSHYMESARAIEIALVYKITRRDFERLLSVHPQMLMYVYKRMVARLMKIERRFVNMIYEKVDKRVREAIADIADIRDQAGYRSPIEISVTQQDIANLIGASRQQTSKALKRLENKGIIELKYGSIIVKSPNKLRENPPWSGD